MGDPAEEPRVQVLATLSPFLRKLWMMVNDSSAKDVIGWNSAGDGFVVRDQVRFVMELLPTYFKHNNMASFVRQLNFYDFHKVGDSVKGTVEFAHPYFLKDLPETLAFISRKPSSGSPSSSRRRDRFEDVSGLLDDIKQLKSKHHVVEAELQKLRRENVSLWHEINTLRYKHTKQAKIIYKLIHFLVSYMHSERERKSTKATLHASPKLLEIDYRGRKRGEIESLLEESSRDSQPEDYTVSYPPGGKDEELSDTEEPEPEEPYTVRFPKGPVEPVELVEPVDEIQKLLETNGPNLEDVPSGLTPEPVQVEDDLFDPGQVCLDNLTEPDDEIDVRNLFEPVGETAPQPDQVATEPFQVEVVNRPEPVQATSQPGQVSKLLVQGAVPSFRIHQRGPDDFVVLKYEPDTPDGKILDEVKVKGTRKRPANRETGTAAKASRMVQDATRKGGGSSTASKPPKPRRKPAQPARLPEPDRPVWTSSEDPHSNLGSYLNSTDSKLNSLRDILKGLDSDRLDSLSLIRWELEDELGRLPDVAQAQGDPAAGLEALLGKGDD